MDTNEIKVGTKVICHGFEGTVTEVCSWNTSLIVVRLDRESVCVGKSQFDGKYKTDYIVSI